MLCRLFEPGRVGGGGEGGVAKTFACPLRRIWLEGAFYAYGEESFYG